MIQLGIAHRSRLFLKSLLGMRTSFPNVTSGPQSKNLLQDRSLSSFGCRSLWIKNTYTGTGTNPCRNCRNILSQFGGIEKVILNSNTSKNSSIFVRTLSSSRGGAAEKKRNQTVLLYICAVGVGMVGLAYAGVPLYKMFCQASGLGGQAVRGHDASKVGDMTKIEDRIIRIQFNADTASSMQWSFRPQQSEVKVAPGETALAFYTAKNPTKKPITGISTYNVVPFDAGKYFNKIQCFCFEEQRLNPQEQVDMPVFFYIDPEFADDPKMAAVDRIVLSYTFFEAKEGFEVPAPPYLQHWRSAT